MARSLSSHTPDLARTTAWISGHTQCIICCRLGRCSILTFTGVLSSFLEVDVVPFTYTSFLPPAHRAFLHFIP